MKVVLARRDTRRLAESADHIRAADPAAARQVQSSIRDAFEILKTFPNVGRHVRNDVRMFVVPQLPYLIYDQVNDARSILTIITIRHAAQRPLD